MPGAWLNNLQSHNQLRRKSFKDWRGKNFDFNQIDYGLRNSSGSLAIFAAIRRASSLVSSLAADLRPGSLS
jgi:hypothetical protein